MKQPVDSGLNEIGFEENLRFISYGFDPVVGKHFAKARFYDGGLGRMLAEDPVKRGLNGYSYCDSDPVNYTDPTGEIPSIVIGGGIGALVGGVFGFGGSALSQIWGGEDFIFRKAFGAAANGAIVGGVRGALIGSGVGAGAALAADFGAGTLGSAAEQLIVNGRVSAKESLKDGLINAVTGRIYGNSKIESLGEALGRGAAAGGVTSGINYLSDAFTPRPGRLGGSTLNGLAGMMLMGAGSAFGRDPRRGCGTGNRDVDWIGERMVYVYQYGVNQTAQKKGGFSFDLADFGKEIFVGAVTGGLASAAFYGAGKAVRALAGSIRSNTGGSSTINEPSVRTRVNNLPETKAPNAIKASDVTNVRDDYLGSNTTNIHPITGKPDFNRIFSSDSTRSVRFGNHEMKSFGTSKAYFHYEKWDYNAADDIMTISNIMQRFRG